MATRPGSTAATSSAATSATVRARSPVVAPWREPEPSRTAIILGSTPVRRTGRGGVSSGAATASTWLATASTSAGVR